MNKEQIVKESFDKIKNYSSTSDKEIEKLKTFGISGYGRSLKLIERISLEEKPVPNIEAKTIWLYNKDSMYNETIEQILNELTKNFEESNVFIWKPSRKIQRGYIKQPLCVVDNINKSIDYSSLLLMTDPSFNDHLRVSITQNHDSILFGSKRIIITSNKSPEQIYSKIKKEEGNLDQLWRRIKLIEINKENQQCLLSQINSYFDLRKQLDINKDNSKPIWINDLLSSYKYVLDNESS